MGQYDDALEYHNKALEIREKVLDPLHPNLAALYAVIGLVYYNKDEYDKCIEFLEKALVIFEKSNHPYAQTVKTMIEEIKTELNK